MLPPGKASSSNRLELLFLSASLASLLGMTDEAAGGVTQLWDAVACGPASGAK